MIMIDIPAYSLCSTWLKTKTTTRGEGFLERPHSFSIFTLGHFAGRKTKILEQKPGGKKQKTKTC